MCAIVDCTSCARWIALANANHETTNAHDYRYGNGQRWVSKIFKCDTSRSLELIHVFIKMYNVSCFRKVFWFGFYLIFFSSFTFHLFFRFNPIKFEKWNYRNSFFRIMKLYLLKFVLKLLWFVGVALYAKKTIAQMMKITSKRMKEDTWWIQRVWRPHRAHQGTSGFSLFEQLFARFNRLTENKNIFDTEKCDSFFFCFLQFHKSGIHFIQTQHCYTFFSYLHNEFAAFHSIYTPCNLIRAFKLFVQFKYLPRMHH